MKGLIIYKSKYGATRQYAEWLGQELGIKTLASEKATRRDIDNASFLIIGTPVYFGKFRIGSWLRKNSASIRDKKRLFLFIVSASAPTQKGKDRLLSENVPEFLLQRCISYFLPGRIIHKDLSWRDKMILKIMGALLKDPKKQQAIRQDLDGVQKENLEALVNAVTSFSPSITSPAAVKQED